MKQNEGLSVHCHDKILIEYCTDYNERVEYIKTDKPENEQEIRLRVFKLLSKESIKALPKNIIKAYADWEKANADWDKANADCEKANADKNKAYDDWEKKEEWHKKYCGCKEWNGKELVFEGWDLMEVNK